jgi:hypothetical protein
MPEERPAGDLAQEVVGAKVVKQRGTGPSAVKLGGPVRPDEKESIPNRGQGYEFTKTHPVARLSGYEQRADRKSLQDPRGERLIRVSEDAPEVRHREP